MNLYGYANGDPINFSDPFGLSADTLRIGKTEAKILELDCRPNKACAAAMDAADAAPHDVYVSHDGNDARCAPDRGACTLNAEVPGVGIVQSQIYFSPSDYLAASKRIGVRSMNNTDVLTHEFTHAVAGRSEVDPIRAQNAARKLMGMPPRK